MAGPEPLLPTREGRELEEAGRALGPRQAPAPGARATPTGRLRAPATPIADQTKVSLLGPKVLVAEVREADELVPPVAVTEVEDATLKAEAAVPCSPVRELHLEAPGEAPDEGRPRLGRGRPGDRS